MRERIGSTLRGRPDFFCAGFRVFLNAFSFDGASFVTVPADSRSLDVTGNQMTIDGWVEGE